MRTLIFGAILLAVAAAGFHTFISSSLAAAPGMLGRLHFSERFAPVLKARMRRGNEARPPFRKNESNCELGSHLRGRGPLLAHRYWGFQGAHA